MEIRNICKKDFEGKGLFSTKEYRKDEVIFELSGEIFSSPSRETIHIGNDKHIYDTYGIFINHSFNPNIRIENVKVIALKDIQEDDEFVFDYNENEINMASPFFDSGIFVTGKKE